jgi:hypothetical protein
MNKTEKMPATTEDFLKIPDWLNKYIENDIHELKSGILEMGIDENLDININIKVKVGMKGFCFKKEDK